jgi:integrase
LNSPNCTFAAALNELPKKLQDRSIFKGLEVFLPEGNAFEDETWNTAAWSNRQDRRGTLTIDFKRIHSEELRNATKLLILHRRRTHQISKNRPLAYLQAAAVLAAVLGTRSLNSLRQKDVVAAERLILRTNCRNDNLNRLATFVSYLSKTYELPVSYSAPKTSSVRHGRRGTEEGRSDKRIPDQVLADLLAIKSKDGISRSDKLFVAAIAFNVGCGFRIGELCTLPADCLFEDSGQLMVRSFPSKGGKAAPKVIPPALTTMVRDSYETILELTNEGRALASKWAESDEPDWRAVAKNREALLYFIKKKVHFWTSDPENRLLNDEAAWHRRRGWLDVVGCLEKHGTVLAASRELSLDWETFNRLRKTQLAAREGRVLTRKTNPTYSSWFRDARVIDKFKLFEDIGFRGGGSRFDGPDLQEILTSAIDFQLSGKCYPLPRRIAALEQRYQRTRPPLLKDTRGKTFLFVDQALFALPLHFVGQYQNVSNEWTVLKPDQIIHWLRGHNNKISVFERYGIIDERNGRTASFTSHQLRHWLETQYHKGGMSDAQIATLMNRTTTKSNSIYNQMTNAERRQTLQNGIRDDTISGHVANVLKRADLTRAEAQAYLAMQTRQVNVMPHGLCLKDLASEPCPHHLSCFAVERKDSETAGVCTHLLVDQTDDVEIAELRRQARHAKAMAEMLEDDPELDSSPQIKHFRRVESAICRILDQDKNG